MQSTQDSALSFDHRSFAFLQNPYDTYAKLRTELPVYWNEPMGGWVLTRHEDVSKLLRDHNLTVAGRGAPPKSMAATDPPDHGRLRGLLATTFSAGGVQRLLPAIRSTVDALLDRMQALGDVDLIRDYAFPLNMQVAAHMLGVPPDALDWLDECQTLGSEQMMYTFPPREYRKRCQVEQLRLFEFLGSLVERRRQQPGDDMISTLVQALSAGHIQTEMEIFGPVIIVLLSFRETNSNMLGNALFRLLKHEPQAARLVDEPAIMDSAIEEMIRLEPPAHFVTRRAKEDFDIHGVTVRKRDILWLCLAGANRDPQVFAAPDAVQLDRHPNAHMSFSGGPHLCQGMHLTRTMLKLAITALFTRFPKLALCNEDPVWSGNVISRGLQMIPVCLN